MSLHQTKDAALLKKTWDIADVIAFPAGEHDYFDRKSAKLLNDSSFREKLAKAFCAFANSGGGQILVGVADDGALEGVSVTHKGRTPTCEWIEQTIPSLVEPVPTKFRVHAIQSSPAHPIPNNGVIILIDIGDSNLAPYQSRVSKIYYYRVGSHSKPAPHFYLDAIRNRTKLPNLTVSLLASKLIRVIQNEDLFLQLVLTLEIENKGNITPTHWHVDLLNGGERIGEDGSIVRRKFPPLTLNWNDRDRVQTTPVLPGQRVTYKEMIGLKIASDSPDGTDVAKSMQEFWASNNLAAAVITNTNLCDECKLDTQLIQESVTNEQVIYWSSEFDKNTLTGPIGGGLTMKRFALGECESPDDHLRFSGEIENESDEHYDELILFTAFLDENQRPTVVESTNIGRLPPGNRRPWKDWVVAGDTSGAKTVLFFHYDSGWLK